MLGRLSIPAGGVLLLSVCLLAPAPARAQGLMLRNGRLFIDRNFWSQEAYKKVKSDAARLVELCGDLEREANNHVAPLPDSLLGRIHDLGLEAVHLQSAIGEIDANVLSLPIVRRADQIKEEAAALEEDDFADDGGADPYRFLRQLAHDVSKRADSVADHMRSP